MIHTTRWTAGHNTSGIDPTEKFKEYHNGVAHKSGDPDICLKCTKPDCTGGNGCPFKKYKKARKSK